MSHNITLNPGAGGDTLGAYDIVAGSAYPTTGKIGLQALMVSPDSTTAPTPVTPANRLPVSTQVSLASAANISAASGASAGLATGPGNWTSFHTPTTATQATITKAAGTTGVRHVCNSITATLACGATAQTPINVYLRDGLTGAGTILWTGVVAAPVNGSAVISVAGLNVYGSAATAMTLEFSAAGVTASLEAVTLGGFDTV